MVKTLFFLEAPEKIDKILSDGAKTTGQSVYVSLSPSASYAFERSNIPYKSVRDFGGGEERYQQGLENFQRIDRITTILDKELAYIHGVPTLTPARYSIYPLKVLFDVLWNTIHILKRIIDTEQPDFIRIYATNKIKSVNGVYTFSSDESVFAEVLTMTGWGIPVEIIQDIDSSIPNPRVTEKKKTITTLLLTWIKQRDLIFNLGLIGKREGIGSIATALWYYIMTWYRKPVLIYESGYNWDDSLIELHKGGILPIYRIMDKTFNETVSKDNGYRETVRKVCNVHLGIREFDHILGIDVSAFFFEILSQIIDKSIQESVVVYPLARKIIYKKKIRCLLHSVRERAIGHVIIQAAHDAGIPVVSWQHGGAGYCYHPMMPFIEFINSDWHFVFGEGVADSYRSTSERIGMEKIPVFVPVGSSSLDTFHKNNKKTTINETKNPVVYITTEYLRNGYMISQPFDPVSRDEQIWGIQKQIINLAKRNPETEFIIKLHPKHKDKEPLKSYLFDHEIHNVKLITSEMTVRELTDGAGVVVFDLISTGILQVLTTDLPVFVYSGLHQIDEQTIIRLKKRASVNGRSEEIIGDLEKYICTKKTINQSRDTMDREFIIGYGTDINNCKSAENAVRKLNEILL
ncbi:MAG: hypothetical protein LUQ50_08560 [Methanospirillum sp.]|uniref:hypothetical protein n=1 Tax=Methanospirillum sp. TaxID=45200 RepID=UPI002374F335|nr:hypothetical protein [Methanospirillum sp.]MDD1729108.1 hypothetical protein [Methanospirillum sp.]